MKYTYDKSKSTICNFLQEKLQNLQFERDELETKKQELEGKTLQKKYFISIIRFIYANAITDVSIWTLVKN